MVKGGRADPLREGNSMYAGAILAQLGALPGRVRGNPVAAV